MEICLAFKNKNSDLRCTKPAKDGHKYCGIHLRSKNPRDFVEEKLDKYEESEFIKIYQTNKKFNIERLRKTCETLGYSNNSVDKVFMFFYFMELLRTNSQDSVIKIQRAFRNYIKNKKPTNFNNVCDFCSLENIEDIPKKYLYIIEEGNINYAFDIRSLYGFWTKDNYGINPYTLNKINDKYLKKYENYLVNLKKNNIILEFDKPILTEKQILDMKIVDLSQKFDSFGYYVNSDWISKLSLNKLHQFYNSAKDIFHFRLELTLNGKRELVKNGQAFNENSKNLEKLSRDKMMELILSEVTRFLTEGKDRSIQITGATLMIMAFVEISMDFATAFPHFLQVLI